MVEITAAEQGNERRMKRNEDGARDIWYNIKHTNIHIIGSQKVMRQGSEKIFEEIIAENFPNMGNETLKSKEHRESRTV